MHQEIYFNVIYLHSAGLGYQTNLTYDFEGCEKYNNEELTDLQKLNVDKQEADFAVDVHDATTHDIINTFFITGAGYLKHFGEKPLTVEEYIEIEKNERYSE